jgi:hypothetical protein
MPPDHAGVLLGAVGLMILGWGGLYILVTTQVPGLGPEIWIFFLLLDMAVTGTAIPVVRWLNVRVFSRRDPPPGGVIVRQSVWIGLFVAICAWLQIGRVLTVSVAFFIVLVFAVLEVYLRMREINAEQ